MSQNASDRLDQLLRQWAVSRELDDAARDQLQRQVMTALARPDEVIHNSEVQTRGRRARFVIMGLLSSCALLLIASFQVGNLRDRHFGTQPLLSSSSAAHNGQGNFPAATRLNNAIVESKTAFLTEMNDIFENRLDWLAEDASRIVFDLESQVSDSPFILVRVVVAQRTANQWSPVWTADVVCRNETLVNVAPEDFGGDTITLWAHALADGGIFIDSEFTMSQGSRFHSAGTYVLRPGVPHRVECISTGGKELCVFQTVLPLDGSSRAT
jgi:hypothetical protein